MVHPLTIAICALTIVFAVASIATLVDAVRWSHAPPGSAARARALMPTRTASRSPRSTLWLTANGWLGFRTWAF